MRFLLDQNLSAEAAVGLRNLGLDVLHTREVGLERADDERILEWCRGQERVVITRDADFHALLALSGETRPSVIRFRIEPLGDRDLMRIIQWIIENKSDELQKDCSWPALRSRSGTDLTDHYAETLRIPGKQPGILGDIYAGAQSRFNNPVNLKKLVSLIDETEWISLGVDVKAEVYEGLLERAANEGKKGAGQYFTPRVLIQSIVRCMHSPRTPRCGSRARGP